MRMQAGTGLTLNKAKTVLMFEIYWNPGIMLQVGISFYLPFPCQLFVRERSERGAVPAQIFMGL